MTRFIVGLGTGRCGTRSLARLLAVQDGVDAAHERRPVLTWKNEPYPDRHFLEGIRRGAEVYADVGFYYLPHVEWLLERYPDTRFICLRRDRTETIESFWRSLPREEDWFRPGGGWRPSFPDIVGGAFAERCGRYWDQYYDAASALASDRFRIFDMCELSTPDGCRRVLEFADISDPVTPEVGVHIGDDCQTPAQR